MTRFPSHTFSRAFSVRHAPPRLPRKGDKVVVGMSGGVDSSVTAKLLADKDFDLSAVFMRNWDSRDEKASDIGCEWEKDWEDVQRVCKMLDIPHRMVDLSRDYWNRVFEPSLRAWESGVTPNPDIWCNKEIKFGSLLEHLPTDTQFVATGHYARKEYDPKTGRPKLLRCADPTKDQTYFLSSISEHGLNKALFPLADLTKTRIREIAHAAGLPTASRAESMGICFVGEKRRFSEFLSDYFPPRPGPICDLGTGRVLAEHTGLWTLTIGQNARVPGMPERMFVVSKDMSSNTIWVSTGASPALRVPSITCSDFAWIWADAPPAGVDSPQGFRASVKVRHKMGHTPCTVFRESSGGVRILFDEPEKGVAEGQVAVLWDGDWCLGCGTINETCGLHRLAYSLRSCMRLDRHHFYANLKGTTPCSRRSKAFALSNISYFAHGLDAPDISRGPGATRGYTSVTVCHGEQGDVARGLPDKTLQGSRNKDFDAKWDVSTEYTPCDADSGTGFSIFTEMKVYCIGGSRNIGYYASLRLLAKGNTVTFLLRSPSVFGEDETMKDYIRSGNARLVKGDALNKEDVQRGWEEAAKPTHEGNHLGVDALLFTLGGTPKFDMFKGLIISPPDLVTHATLNVLTTLPTHDLRIITVTSTGLTKQSHHELPMAMRAMYGYLLRSPHADKQGVETVLARAAGTTVDETMAPPEGILPAGWERDPTFPAPGALHDNLVIIRPAFLTDGPCHSETKGPSVVRTRVEADLPVKGGYTISRQDVAYFIAERVLGDEWEQWKGKGISLSH